MGNDTLRKFMVFPMSGSQTNIPAEEKYERCICCKEPTNVLRATPVDEREYFIHGCGQLCPNCYKRFNAPNGAGNELTNGQMEDLIEASRLSEK